MNSVLLPAVLETDHFCEGCGYNLHGQVVTRDPSLGLMVCRCPECGRYHAAGAGTTASKVWLRRFGTFLLVGWVLTVVVICLAATTLLGGLQAAHLYGYTETQWIPLAEHPHPRETVISRWYDSSTPSTYLMMRRHPYEPPRTPQERYDRYDPGNLPAQILVATSAASAFLFGAFVTVAMWHVSPRRRQWALLSPILAGAAVLGIWFYWPETEHVRAWGALRVVGYVLWESAFLVLGLYLGRKIARGLARVVVPPKPRQLLAFLWTADGLEPPRTGR